MNPARYLPAGVSIHSLPNQPNQYRLTNLAAQESQLIVLPGLNYDISATQLRSQIQGQSGSQPALLDPAVLQYIQHHHLYQ
jgi:nicotinic acid mononucleotide adenylyltransferase